VSKIRFAQEDLKHIALFESMTHSKVKDFIREEDTLAFLVEEGQMGQAIGKGGSKISKVREAFGKNIYVFEYSQEPESFLKNLFSSAEIHALDLMKTSGGKTGVVEIARAQRSRVMGPGGVKMRIIRSFADRHHGIDEISLRAY
jgi:N utilization substance protein A